MKSPIDTAVVIGSGPAGISTAQALLRRGRRVTLIDVGIGPESSATALELTLQSTPQAEWPELTLSERDSRGMVVKRVFGSNFALNWADSATDVISVGAAAGASFAAGGMSRVWGGNFVTLPEDEFDSWPINRAELLPFYREVLDFVPWASGDDGSARFGAEPSWPREAALPQSAQIERLAQRLKGRSVPAGLLAVEGAKHAVWGSRCQLCRACLCGCPWGLIYSAHQTLESLHKDPRFEYRGGLLVDRVIDSGERVTVLGRTLHGNEPFSIATPRVFLAAGALNSTRIVLESFERFDRPILLKENSYAVVPVLLPNRGPDRDCHSLSELIISFRVPDSRYPLHALMYSASPLIRTGITSRLPPVLRNSRVLSPLLSRLGVIQMYLHSEDSVPVELSIERPQGNRRRFTVRPGASDTTSTVLRSGLRTLRRLIASAGGLVLTPVAQRGLPGQSYHLGASYPLSPQGGEGKSDMVGRPDGLGRVHLTDSSCLPAIPAPNLTWTMVANATRIVDRLVREGAV